MIQKKKNQGKEDEENAKIIESGELKGKNHYKNIFLKINIIDIIYVFY